MTKITKKTTREVRLAAKEEILKLQGALLSKVNGVTVVDTHDTELFPLKHTFADGIYVRQMSMDKGSVVIGQIHNHLHVWFLLTGHISVATNEIVEDYIAPCYVVAKPGTKRVIQANEDSIFVNIHKNPTNTQNIKELEAELVSFDEAAFKKYITKTK